MGVTALGIDRRGQIGDIARAIIRGLRREILPVAPRVNRGPFGAQPNAGIGQQMGAAIGDGRRGAAGMIVVDEAMARIDMRPDRAPGANAIPGEGIEQRRGVFRIGDRPPGALEQRVHPGQVIGKEIVHVIRAQQAIDLDPTARADVIGHDRTDL